MSCRSCGFEHPLLMRCEAAARLRVVTNTNVSRGTVTNTVTNGSDTSVEVARVVRWREGNRDRYRATQRELMRKRRAAAKAGFSGG